MIPGVTPDMTFDAFLKLMEARNVKQERDPVIIRYSKNGFVLNHYFDKHEIRVRRYRKDGVFCYRVAQVKSLRKPIEPTGIKEDDQNDKPD